MNNNPKIAIGSLVRVSVGSRQGSYEASGSVPKGKIFFRFFSHLKRVRAFCSNFIF